MKTLKLRKSWLKPLSGVLLASIVTIGIAGCDDDVVRSPSYGSSYYHPYDYYYYPNTRIYFNITTGYYYYPYNNHWRKVRSLPRHYHLRHNDRVKIRIKSNDQPYLRHHEHRTKYGPRTRYNRDNYRDQRYKDKNRNIKKNRTKSRVKSHDYYYYPKSRVYYNAASGNYYYPDRDKWKRNNKLPSRYRLDNRQRVKVKVKSKDMPYLRNNEHRVRYAPRANYQQDKRRLRVNPYNNRGVKVYEKGGM